MGEFEKDVESMMTQSIRWFRAVFITIALCIAVLLVLLLVLLKYLFF